MSENFTFGYIGDCFQALITLAIEAEKADLTGLGACFDQTSSGVARELLHIGLMAANGNDFCCAKRAARAEAYTQLGCQA